MPKLEQMNLVLGAWRLLVRQAHTSLNLTNLYRYMKLRMYVTNNSFATGSAQKCNNHENKILMYN